MYHLAGTTQCPIPGATEPVPAVAVEPIGPLLSNVYTVEHAILVKPRAPNVTCNLLDAGLASNVCHFRKTLGDQPRKGAFSGQPKPRRGLFIGLGTVYPQHVGVSMLLQENAIDKVISKAKGTRPC
jgi:hypothetical protein